MQFEIWAVWPGAVGWSLPTLTDRRTRSSVRDTESSQTVLVTSVAKFDGEGLKSKVPIQRRRKRGGNGGAQPRSAEAAGRKCFFAPQ